MKRSNARKFKWLRRRFAQTSSSTHSSSIAERHPSPRRGSLHTIAFLLLFAAMIFAPRTIVQNIRAYASGPLATNDANHLWPRFTPMTVINKGDSGMTYPAPFRIAVDGKNIAHVIGMIDGNYDVLTKLIYRHNTWRTRQADGWSPKVEVTLPTTSFVGDPSLATLADGTLHVAWSRWITLGSGGYSDIFYMTYNPLTETWSAPIQYATGTYLYDQEQQLVIQQTGYSDPQLTADDAGNIHLACYRRNYSETDPRDIREVLYSANWGALETVTGATGDALDGVDFPTSMIQIAADLNNIPHVAWIREATPAPTRDARYNNRQGGVWQAATLIDADAEIVRLTTDRSGEVHFATFDVGGAPSIEYRRLSALGSPESVTGSEPVHISMRGDKPQILSTWAYAVRGNTTWSSQDPLIDIDLPLADATADKNGTIYALAFGIGDNENCLYTRMIEPNLGAQDGMAAFGMGPNTSANVATGNLMTTLPIFSSRGVGFATGLALTYNSLDPDSGVVSQGWQYNYQMTLTDHDGPPPDPIPEGYIGKISVKFGDGHTVVFPYNATLGSYVADTEYGFPAEITRLGAEYVLFTKFGIKYTFNSSGKLREILDTNGNTLTLAYTNGLLTSIVDSANRTTTLAYNADKQLETITDPGTKTYTVTYNAQKKMAKLAFNAVAGIDWELDHYTADNFAYGERINLLKTIKTPRDNVTLFNYQPDNRIWKSTDPPVDYLDDAGTPQNGSLTRQIAYNDTLRQATFTNRRLKNTKIDFLQRYALVTKVTDHLNNFIARSFDTANLNRNLLSFTDKKTNPISYTYATTAVPAYVNDNLATITRPGIATPITYTYTADELNRVDTVTDAKGALTDYNYDIAGNLEEIVYSAAPISQNGEPEQTLASSESFLYDAQGRMTQSTNADGVKTFFETPDPATGLFTRTRVEGLQPDVYEFDVMGNTLRHTDPSGSVTKTDPDNLYRPVTVTSAFGTPDAIAVVYGYDADSNTETVTDPKKTMTYVYNAVGRQTQVKNNQKTAPNDTIKYSYDQEGNTRKVEDYVHNVTETRYNDLGQAVQEILPGPPQIVTAYTYDLNGNVETVTRNGKATGYTYDVRNNQKTVTYPPAADQIVETSYYDDNDNHKGTIRRKGATFVAGSKSTHDARNRVQESQQLSLDPGVAYMKGDGFNAANGPVTAYAYRHGGDRTSVSDADNHTSVTLFNAVGQPEKVKDAAGIIASRTTYNDNGQVFERYMQNPAVPNPSGDGSGNLILASRSIYNGLGQVREQYDAQLNKTEYVYGDANRNLTMIVDAENHVTEMHYNNLDQMDWKKEYLVYPSSFVLTQFTYDDNGNMASVIDPRNKTYGYTYDQSGRLVAIAYPILGHTESWVYNEDGNLWKHFDPNGKETEYLYDDLGRVVTETHKAPFNMTLSRTYDAASNLAEITDGNIRKVNSFNALNRLTGVQYHIGGAAWKSVGYTYTAGGSRESMTDPENNVFNYSYTLNSQLSQITRGSLLVAGYTYDSGGRKIRSDLANGTSLRYRYDIKERLANVRAVKSTGGVVSSFTYSYNKVDNRTSMTIDHENVLVNYGYDGLSRLMSESWNLGAGSSCANQFTSQPAGNESGFSNTVQATPAAGVLTSPYLAAYLYDNAGNRTARYRLDGGSTYAVDDENRLISESPFTAQALVPSTTTVQDNWVELDFGSSVSIFRMDVSLPDVNRRFKVQYWDGSAYQDISALAALGASLEADGWYRPFSSGFSVLGSLFSSKVRYFQESGSSAGVNLVAWTMVASPQIAYGYDANGNQTSRTQGTTVETYAHDYANRIVTYSDQQAAYSYIFAPSGERMAKVNPDLSSEWYMYDGDDVVSDYALPSGGQYALTATYANGLGIDSKICKYDASGAASYYIPDALGSVHKILDGAQNVVNTYLTNAWGESIISIEGQTNRYGFTHRERDPESSLMHYRARSYDPRLGRFVQMDPVREGRNHYVYATNNPLIYSDPSGTTIRVSEKAREGIEKLLKDNGITNYGLKDLVISGDPSKLAHNGDNGSLVTEILWRLVISPREFPFADEQELKNFMNIQQNIINAAKEINWKLGNASLPEGWRIAKKGKLEDYVFAGEFAPAVDTWFVKDNKYLSGCGPALQLASFRGLKKYWGSGFITTNAGPEKRLNALYNGVFMGLVTDDKTDWVPGEFGYYINDLHKDDEEGLLQGENIIYLGGDGKGFFKIKDDFVRESRFLGILKEGQKIRSLGDWEKTVLSFNKPEEKGTVTLRNTRGIIKPVFLEYTPH